MQKFTKGSLGKIGGESERTSNGHRNEDIDSERSEMMAGAKQILIAVYERTAKTTK